MTRRYVTHTKADKQPPSFPKEVEPIGPRLYRDPRTGDELEVVWNGDKRDGYLTVGTQRSQPDRKWPAPLRLK